jgi:hypothetical protein
MRSALRDEMQPPEHLTITQSGTINRVYDADPK